MQVVVSYPKCGRTWVRYMVNCYLIKRLDLSIDDVVQMEKQMVNTPNQFHWSHMNGAMFLKKPYWDMGTINKTILAHPVTLIARNFYGAMASAYYHGRFRKQFFELEPSAFLRCPRFGIAKMISFYNQIDELAQVHPNFNCFRYADLQADVRGVFVQMLKVFNQPVIDSLVDEVIEQGKLANMQITAAQPRYADTWLGEVDPKADMNENVTVGNNKKYHQLFDADDLDYIDKMIDMLMINKDADYLGGCLTPPPIKK